MNANSSRLVKNDTKSLQWLFAFYYHYNTTIQIGWLSWVVTLIVDTYTKKSVGCLNRRNNIFVVQLSWEAGNELPHLLFFMLPVFASIGLNGMFNISQDCVSTDVDGKRWWSFVNICCYVSQRLRNNYYLSNYIFYIIGCN